MSFDFTKRLTRERKEQFAVLIKGLSRIIGFKVSSRGWCYIMEQKGYINKDQFDKVTNAINDCRKEGLIPVDFVAEEKARALCTEAIEFYLGEDSAERFQARRDEIDEV